VGTQRRALIGSLVALALAVAVRLDASPPAVTVSATAPVVEVLDPSGAIDAAAVQDAIGKRARDLARCGSEASWNGDALAWIVVDWHGKVSQLELAVDKPAVETCLSIELRKLVIARAQGRATIFARLRVTAIAGGKRTGPTEEPPLKRGEVRATWIAPGSQFADPDRVRDLVRQQLQDVALCYQHALETRPRLTGTAAIELTVATTGAIESAAVGSTPAEMADCVKRAMLGIRLPAPAGIGKVRVELQLGPAK
jgi:hypothetical protein